MKSSTKGGQAIPVAVNGIYFSNWKFTILLLVEEFCIFPLKVEYSPIS